MKGENRCRMLILAGPNGAGKTTLSARLLAGENRDLAFLNADLEAQSLSPANVSNVAIPAARKVLRQMAENIRTKRSFAVETTLSGRAHLRHIVSAVAAGWTVDLHFLWLENATLAHKRVAARVASGGHDIPEDVITRRYFRGLRMLPIYCREVSRWTIIDNSSKVAGEIAMGSKNVRSVISEEKFKRIELLSIGGWK